MPVDRTRRRKDVSPNAVLACGHGEALGAVDVHAAGQLGLELAGWVVRDPRQIDDAIDRCKDPVIEAPHVTADDAKLRAVPDARWPEGVAKVQPIDDCDPVTLFEQERHQNGSDIAGPAGDENVHEYRAATTKVVFLTASGSRYMDPSSGTPVVSKAQNRP